MSLQQALVRNMVLRTQEVLGGIPPSIAFLDRVLNPGTPCYEAHVLSNGTETWSWRIVT
jgi:hypothetical protein